MAPRESIAFRRHADDAPRLRWFLAVCGAAAIVVATVAQLWQPSRGQPLVVWLGTVLLPATIVGLIVGAGRRPGVLVLAGALLYVEALLLASLFVIGIAFAILLPIIAIGILEPMLSGWPRIATYAAAAIVATLAVALGAAGVPPNGLRDDNPLLSVVAFGLVAAFALGLTWHSGQRLRRALDAASREIGARAEAEGRLRETAETLERLVASSPVPTAAIDADGRVSVWNPAAERLFGWRAREVVGHRPPRQAFGRAVDAASVPGGVDARPLGEWFAAALRGDTVSGEMAASSTRAGRPLLVEVHAAPRTDPQGRSRGAIVQVTDVTERAGLEAQLRQAQKMEAVGHLAGGIAHDVNNTLTAVGGFAEMIVAETHEPEVRSDAEMIARAVSRASELTRRLLAFARRSVLQPRTIDVSEYLAGVRPMLERLLGGDVTVVVEESAPGATIKVDPGQFEQAILNLAVNSRDAMPGGGTLTISTRRERRTDGGSGTTGWLVVTVSDTGVGIPPELQEQVFEPFVTTKAQGEGTGLGLAMVYGFVKQSGGEVTLSSAVGQGTSIEIRLPEVAEPPAPAPAVAAPIAPATGNETILLIEDEAAVAEFIHKVLAGLGYTVLTAHGGRQAMSLARGHDAPIDLILSDVIMPGLIGPEAVEAVRTVHPEARVLYVSGYTADAIADRGVLPPDVELLQKPFTPGELAARVRGALDALDRG